MRGVLLAVLLVAAVAPPARAEWQFKPYLGVKFGGTVEPVFVDLDQAAGTARATWGGSVVFLGEVLGVEADVAHTSGFFQAGSRSLVLSSSATTITGNLVVALPRRWTEYTLRPYVVGGGGLMRAHVDDLLNVLPVSANLAAFDAGAGVTGFLTRRIGVGWDVRYFRSIHGGSEPADIARLSFWRASMALAVRY